MLIAYFCCIPVRGDERVQNGKTLRLLVINVWSGLDYQGILNMGVYETDSVREERYQVLTAQIRQLDPDVIAVHEANKLPRYARRLAEDTGYQAFYHMGLGGVRMGPVGLPWNLREGDALLIRARLRPEWIGRKKLTGGYVGRFASFHFSDATQVIAVKIEYNTKSLYVYATHWHASVSDSVYFKNRLNALYQAQKISGEAYNQALSDMETGLMKRMNEARQTVAFIRQTAEDHPYILLGDLNAVPCSQEIRFLAEKGMTDLFHHVHPDSAGYTWNPETNQNIRIHSPVQPPDKNDTAFEIVRAFHARVAQRIDYVFWGPRSWLVSEKISVLSCKVVMDRPVHQRHASDHYGVFAEIYFND